MSEYLCVCVCQPASMSLFYFLLALHESRKSSPTQKVRSWLMRSECYLPALATSVIRYVLEPLTGANIGISWMFFPTLFKQRKTQLLVPQPLGRQTILLHLCTLIRCYLKGGCYSKRRGASLTREVWIRSFLNPPV